uniref:Si946088d04 n=1 Tax=Arundo donax TaxID=35708 RepID=A0A0A9E2V7_ARUDO
MSVLLIDVNKEQEPCMEFGPAHCEAAGKSSSCGDTWPDNKHNNVSATKLL